MSVLMERKSCWLMAKPALPSDVSVTAHSSTLVCNRAQAAQEHKGLVVRLNESKIPKCALHLP